ncbi:MAG: cupin domain-containing protein, partial [Candidatus Dormibacteraeota bacterium]|nr:cupin domain-containing protein [Candidatus Dormibacteraeota bacterium]
FGLSRDGKLSPKGDINLLQGAVLLQEVGDFIRPASPPIAVQKAVLPVLAALGWMRGYRARYRKYALPTE